MNLDNAWMWFMILLSINYGVAIMGNAWEIELGVKTEAPCWMPTALGGNLSDTNVLAYQTPDLNNSSSSAFKFDVTNCAGNPNPNAFDRLISGIFNIALSVPGLGLFVNFAYFFIVNYQLVFFGLLIFLSSAGLPWWMITIFAIPNILIVVIGMIQISGFVVNIVKRFFGL